MTEIPIQMHVCMADISSDNPNNHLWVSLYQSKISGESFKKYSALRLLMTFDLDDFQLQFANMCQNDLLNISWKQRLPWPIAIGEHLEQ